MDYKKRIVDDLLDLKLESFGATLIVGRKQFYNHIVETFAL